MHSKSKVLVISVIVLTIGVFICLPLGGAEDQAAKQSPQKRGDGRVIIVPPAYPYYPYDSYSLTDQNYFRRLLEDYERANSNRFSTIQSDITSIDQDLQSVFDRVKANESDTQTILRKLEKIERDLGNVSGRLKKAEQTLTNQSRVLRRLSNRLGEPNTPDADPNS
ncbi:MAG: hypothetical protein A2Y07_02050 [Planctomycetes bacterium GWF2_50_10]|nr:MAG: hypothetical protein A2Y07_02050 [Planctomycetes bacterium GWF2_50_10]